VRWRAEGSGRLVRPVDRRRSGGTGSAVGRGCLRRDARAAGDARPARGRLTCRTFARPGLQVCVPISGAGRDGRLVSGLDCMLRSRAAQGNFTKGYLRFGADLRRLRLLAE